MYCWLVLILLFYVYVCLRVLFSHFCYHKTTNSFIFVYFTKCNISQIQNAKYKKKKQWQNTMSLFWKTKVRTTDVTSLTWSFLCTTNTCIGLIYKKCNKIMSHRHLKKVTYTKSNITYCHVHVINIITYCIHVTYYVTYMLLT